MSLETFWTAQSSVSSLWIQRGAQALGPHISAASESLLIQQTPSPWSIMLLVTGPDFRMFLIPSSCLTSGKSTLRWLEWFHRCCVVTRNTLQNAPGMEDLKTHKHTHENKCKGKRWEKLLQTCHKPVPSSRTFSRLFQKQFGFCNQKNWKLNKNFHILIGSSLNFSESRAFCMPLNDPSASIEKLHKDKKK